jgi:synaptobrevin family protein YKT6
MKLIGAVILRINTMSSNATDIIDEYFNLGFIGFFSRRNIKDLLLFFCEEISLRLSRNENFPEKNFNIVFEDKTNSFGCFKQFGDYMYCILYDNEYPLNVVKKIIFAFREQKLRAEFIVEKYKNPDVLDDLKQIKDIQAKLNDTREVLYDTIDSVLDRGEKLDDLVLKSEQLSKTSKDFYGKTKSMNSCCSVS